MKYAIHKSLNYTAEEINHSIENAIDLPDVSMEMASDGWIIIDPLDKVPERWTRNKDDYRIETLNNDIQKEEEVYDGVIFNDDKTITFYKENFHS